MKLMGFDSEKWQYSAGKQAAAGFVCSSWREAFQIFTVTLLSLLLPLSFLLLARLSTAHYLLAVTDNPSVSRPKPSTLLSFLFLYGNSTVLYFLLSLVSVAAFVHGLSGRAKFLSQSSEPTVRPRLYAAWILLCALQVCVGLGIEGSIAAGIDGSGFSRDTSLLSRVVFFLGLHETMRFWSASVVKPVVDDTVLGYIKEERWVERVAMSVSFGSLWWWSLRDEIESLVAVAELKRELWEGVGVRDFIGWWLFYLTVSIGAIRILKGVISLGMVTLSRNVEGGEFVSDCDSQEIDEKV